jgi:hypothetical protein
MINPDNDPFKFISRTDKSERASQAEGTSENKPRRTPNARKDFKEILGDKKDESEDGESLVSKAEADHDKNSSFMSLFGRESTKKPHAEAKTELGESVAFEKDAAVKPSLLNQPNFNNEIKHAQIRQTTQESPSAVFGKLSSQETKETESSQLAKKGKFNSQYAQGQVDITYLNPNPPVTDVNSSINLLAGEKIEQTVQVKSPIHDIVVEMIEKLAKVEMKGQTDTVITLNMPGMFKGTIVVISEFDTANGQLNLAFENLTAQAKNILDSLPNRENLMTLLSEKGYVVQQMVTTTTIEHKSILLTQGDASGKPREENPRDGDFTQQKKKGG